MNIKDFKVGQQVYRLEFSPRDGQHKLAERKITKVGRIYVTDDCGCRYEEAPAIENGVAENMATSGNGYLFPTMEAAENHIEKVELKKWLVNLNFYDCAGYTLDQLRKVKEILTENN